MLQIRATYLTDRVYAASFLDRDVVEWPPHPDRLFSALRAALSDGGLGDAARAALRWLEAQDAPAVVAGPADPRTVTKSFVPVNHRDHGGLDRIKQPRTFPSAYLPHPTVDFVWTASAPADVLGALSAICAAMSRLGHSASLVTAAASDVDGPSLDGRTLYRPSADGDTLLRVPEPGRLDALESSFDAGRWPDAGRVVRYATEAPIGARSDWAIAAIFAWSHREDGDPRLPHAADTLPFIEGVRAAWMARLGEGGATIPACVSGHDGPHVALCPLIRVGDRHADGRIHGLAVLRPRDARTGEERLVDLDALPGAIDRLAGGEIRTAVARGRLVPDDGARATLAAPTWTRPSRAWVSVTPVVLDRFPKRGQTADDVVRRSIAEAGLPAPEVVACGPFSPLHGTPRASEFAVRREKQPPAPWHHVAVRFANPVEGPIGLGRGRHFGLGWLRPIDDARLADWLGEAE